MNDYCSICHPRLLKWKEWRVEWKRNGNEWLNPLFSERVCTIQLLSDRITSHHINKTVLVTFIRIYSFINIPSLLPLIPCISIAKIFAFCGDMKSAMLTSASATTLYPFNKPSNELKAQWTKSYKFSRGQRDRSFSGVIYTTVILILVSYNVHSVSKVV